MSKSIREANPHSKDPVNFARMLRKSASSSSGVEGFKDPNKPLFTSNEWTMETIQETWDVIDDIARNVFGLDYYPPQFEIVTYEQMLDRYTSHGFPTLYKHWSFGKAFIEQHKEYTSGQSGLAYEIVINTNPTIASIMESNTMTMQALVMAHSICGHGSFFKNNYLFKEWTNPDTILGYLNYAKKYIADCELKYGETAVEEILDAAHSLQHNGMDRMKRGPKIKKAELKNRKEVWADYLHETINRHTTPDELASRTKKIEDIIDSFDQDRRTFPEENLLYFIEKYSPKLKEWQREIVRIVRKIAQNFYPNYQDKMMNEGWASFVHYHLMTELETEGYLTAGQYLEFLTSHTGVCNQHPKQAGFNPYALGFAIFRDIERICKDPTAEDKEWFPEFAGNPDWMGVCKEAVALYRDESFIQKFLSPKVIRDFKMYAVKDDTNTPYYEIKATAHTDDVEEIRNILSRQYIIDRMIPHIEITGVDWEDTRGLELLYHSKNGVLLKEEEAKQTVNYIKALWGYPVVCVFKGEQHLLEAIEELLRFAYKFLSNQDRQWAPVYNSLAMLREIRDNVGNVVYLRARYDSGHLMVGLLAAKGFDGITESNMCDYRDYLHHIDFELREYIK